MEGFPLGPLPKEGGQCPRCALPLGDLTLRPAGWRFMVQGACPRCGHSYLQDLPSGHALVYPACLDLDTGETFQRGDGFWFGAWLRPSYEQPDFDPVAFSVERRSSPGSFSVLNCLDQIYGHSLLKLLSARAMLDPDGRGLVVLVPAALRSLVPAEAAEVWVVDETSARCGKWLTDLEEKLAAEIKRLGDCTLLPVPPHPDPSGIDLDQLIPNETPEALGEPSVVLALRADRTWGGSREVEDQNIDLLIAALKVRFPGAGVTAIGLGSPGSFRDVLDLRSQSPDEELERRWIRVLRGADVTVGVHGSNMLLPSALSAATLELLPQSRFGNLFQATVTPDREPVLALLRHRTLYGDEDLGDITPERVAEVATAALRENQRAAGLLTGSPPAATEKWAPVKSDPPVATEEPSEPGLAQRVRDAAAVRTRLHNVKARAEDARASIKAKSTRLPITLPDSRGNLFELEHSEEVAVFASHGGHFEAAEIDLITSFLSPGMTALDVGANVGAFTAAMASAVGPGGVVHAFEPDPGTRERLARTIVLNELTNVKVFSDAVGDAVGTADFFRYAESDASWSGMNPREAYDGERLVKPSSRITVDVVTLEAHFERSGIKHVEALKVDAEGADAAALRGAGLLLSRGAIDFVLVEVSDNTLEEMGDTAQGLQTHLEKAGMRTFELADGLLTPRRIAGPQRALLNLIALSPSGLGRAAELGLIQ